MTFTEMLNKLDLKVNLSADAQAALLKRYGSVEALYSQILESKEEISQKKKIRTNPEIVQTVFTNLDGSSELKAFAGTDEILLDITDAHGYVNPDCDRAGCLPCCAGKIQSGTVDQSLQSFLDDDQIEAGYIIMCASFPTSDVEILTHQEEFLY
jgi:ferredoxin